MNETSASSSRSRLVKYLPAVLVLVFALYLISALKVAPSTGSFDTATFSQLPVLQGGRVKPIDTVARTSLLLLSGKQTVALEDGTSKTAIEWFLDSVFAGDRADIYPVFEIDDPDVLGVLGVQQNVQRRFPFTLLLEHMDDMRMQANLAGSQPEDARTRFQSALLHLSEKIFLYQQLKATFQIAEAGSNLEAVTSFDAQITKMTGASLDQAPPAKEVRDAFQHRIERFQEMAKFSDLMPIPLPGKGVEQDHDWTSIGRALLARFESGGLNPALLMFARMSDTYAANDAETFNRTVAEYSSALKTMKPRAVGQASSEALFNNFEPFYKSMAIYLVVLVLAFVFWLVQNPLFNRLAFALLLLAFSVHTLGLGARIILQGRPPVTNLYSSAVFVGWAAVFLGIILEKFYKNGVGNVVAGMIGFTTLIIAHHLALQGDTMEMMRAVLDSNFWLATHVVTVTIGYSSTFLAGLIGIVYLTRRAFDKSFDADTAETLGRMAYGIVCFSTIFSFVGTVLGGIWADQSWGRFWGWDPKENGALLVVLWNILILHSRYSSSVKAMMMLTVFGNVVTAFSWFGVNMLGVGLHSYGFMDKALSWIIIFAVSQAAIISFGYLPEARQKRGSDGLA